ncbi:MAG: PIG-L family deacetylase [Bdellovibrionales bacterium]|nr:PIG-L family deacetylase [Bdellovibrionales bacterium]
MKRFWPRVKKKFIQKLNEHVLFPILTNDWKKVDDFDLIIDAIKAGYFRSWLRPFEFQLETISRIVVIAPHQDDEVIGCGGLLLKFKKNNPKIKISIIYITDGNQPLMKGGEVNSIKIRKSEAQRVCNYIGGNGVFFDIPNFNFIIHSEIVQQLVTVLSEMEPELILTPWVLDEPYKHRLSNYLLYKALESIPYDPAIWGYQVHNQPFPNLYVTIDDQLEEKLKLTRMYSSQLEYVAPYDHYVRGMAIWGAKTSQNTSIRYAELFHATSKNNFIKFFKEIVAGKEKYYLKEEGRAKYIEQILND